MSQRLFIYHSCYTSNFESTYKNPLFVKVAIFSDLILVSKYHGCKGGTTKPMQYYMIDIIYKTVKQSHLKNLQIKKNINNLMIQVILTFSNWILIKKILIYSNSSYCWGERDFQKNAGCLGDWVISLCLRCDDKNLGESFEWGRVKIPRFNAFSRKVKYINLKNVSYIWWSIQFREKIWQASRRDKT